MSTLRKFAALFLAVVIAVGPGLAAVGSWNGVAFTAWNGVAQTSWDGTSISCASGSFTAQTAIFDGTNDYIGRTSNLAGIADAKTVTLSFWIKLNDGAGTGAMNLFTLANAGSNRFVVIRNATTKLLRVLGRNAAGTTILDLTSTNTLSDTDAWIHVLMCFDLANSSNRKIYFNGSSETLIVTTYTDDSMDLSVAAPGIVVGADSGGNNKANASYAEFWFNNVYLDDLTKFVSGGIPISLGTTGQTPTGSSPPVYLSLAGSGNSWATDSSSNVNTFTVTGTLGTDTPP